MAPLLICSTTPSIYLSKLINPAGVDKSTGIRIISVPAFIASLVESILLKCSEIAAISIASVTTTPENPISFLKISVKIVFDNVAGKYISSPVDLEI